MKSAIGNDFPICLWFYQVILLRAVLYLHICMLLDKLVSLSSWMHVRCWNLIIFFATAVIRSWSLESANTRVRIRGAFSDRWSRNSNFRTVMCWLVPGNFKQNRPTLSPAYFTPEDGLSESWIVVRILVLIRHSFQSPEGLLLWREFTEKWFFLHSAWCSQTLWIDFVTPLILNTTSTWKLCYLQRTVPHWGSYFVKKYPDVEFGVSVR